MRDAVEDQRDGSLPGDPVRHLLLVVILPDPSLQGIGSELGVRFQGTPGLEWRSCRIVHQPKMSLPFITLQ